MEYFILRIVAIACVTIINLTIIISRKDDVGISPIIIAVLLEFFALIVIFSTEIIESIKGLITLF